MTETDARLDWIEKSLKRSPTRDESAAFIDGFRAAQSVRPEAARTAWISTRQYDAPLPKDEEVVLIWYNERPGGWRVYLGRYLHILRQWRPIGGNGDFGNDISHWMPLPDKPSPQPQGKS